jgi:hypothetical protein
MKGNAHLKVFAMQLLEIRAHQVDQVFGQLRSNLFLGSIHKMETNVGLQHLGHQAVDAAPHRRQQHQLAAAILICHQRALDCVQLTAQLLQSLLQFNLLPLLVRQCAPPWLDNTHPRYGIY